MSKRPEVTFSEAWKAWAELRGYLQAAREVAALPDETLTRTNPAVERVMEDAGGALIPQLRALHRIYADHVRKTNRTVTWIEIAMWGSLMGLLLVETLLIFRPLSKQARDQLDDLRAAYLQLEDEKRKFEGTLRGAPDAMILVDTDGHITKANLAAEEMFGYVEEDLVGKPIEILVPEDMRGGHEAIREGQGPTCMPGLMGRQRDIMAVRADGKNVPVEINLNTVNLDAESVVIATVRDITVRRAALTAAEEARVQAEQANAAKNAYLVSLGEELSRPLARIAKEARQLTAQGQRSAIPGAIWRLQGLLDEIGDLGRVENGDLAVMSEVIDLCGPISESVANIEPYARESGVTIVVGSTAPARTEVFADRARLRQILFNLMSNGIKYNHPGGKVTLSTEITANGDVRVMIDDTGVGVEPQWRDRLFTAFDRLGQAEGQIEGAGAGLALARRLARAMGGDVIYEPLPGAGSRFAIILPPPPRETHGELGNEWSGEKELIAVGPGEPPESLDQSSPRSAEDTGADTPSATRHLGRRKGDLRA